MTTGPIQTPLTSQTYTPLPQTTSENNGRLYTFAVKAGAVGLITCGAASFVASIVIKNHPSPQDLKIKVIQQLTDLDIPKWKGVLLGIITIGGLIIIKKIFSSQTPKEITLEEMRTALKKISDENFQLQNKVKALEKRQDDIPLMISRLPFVSGDPLKVQEDLHTSYLINTETDNSISSSEKDIKLAQMEAELNQLREEVKELRQSFNSSQSFYSNRSQDQSFQLGSPMTPEKAQALVSDLKTKENGNESPYITHEEAQLLRQEMRDLKALLHSSTSVTPLKSLSDTGPSSPITPGTARALVSKLNYSSDAEE